MQQAASNIPQAPRKYPVPDWRASRAWHAALICLAALGGCATPVTVQRAQNLSDAGIAYGNAASQLMDQTRDRYIDYNSDELLAEIDGLNPCTDDELLDEDSASEDCKETISSFDDSQKRVGATANLMTQLGVQAQAMSAYFGALQSLADEGSGAAVEASASRLSTQINGLNTALGGEAILTDAQKSAYSALAGYAADAYKAGVLKRVMARDAQTITLAIELQDRVVETNISVLKAIGAAEDEEDYLTQVRRPYLLGAPGDASNWKSQRKQLLLRQSVVSQLESLRVASQRLRGIWDDILHNRSTLAETQMLLDDIAKALDLISAARDANASSHH